MSDTLFDVEPAPVQPHILVATVSDSDSGSGTGLEYSIECPGVTSRCRMWLECRPCNRQAAGDPWFAEQLHADGEAHGEEHQRIDDHGWSVPTSRCYLTTFEDLADIAESIATEPGRYPVLVDFDDAWPVLELVR